LLKINTVTPQTILPVFARKMYDIDPFSHIKEQQFDENEKFREERTRRTLKIEALRNGKEELDPIVIFLIDKFKSGNKLTHEEFSFLRKNVQGIIDHIERILLEREFIEEKIKVAPTKMDVQNVVLFALQQVAKHPVWEERVIRAMHIADAQYHYMQLDDYIQKPNNTLNHGESAANLKCVNKNDMKNTLVAIVAYEQAKR